MRLARRTNARGGIPRLGTGLFAEVDRADGARHVRTDDGREGCCWALMLLLFAAGVMNVVGIVALTGFVAFEKLVPLGRLGARISGATMIAASC
jgi:hypothetical protein